ncbi:MAG: DUF4157 domain-containing protein, partial [Myxococcota bacterium]
MTTFNAIPQALLDSEHALVDHHRARIDTLLAQLDPSSEHAIELSRIRSALSDEGLNDLLVDRLEQLAAQLTRQPELDYLLDTEPGQALRERSAEQLRHAEQTVRAVASQLGTDADDTTRLRVAGAVRDALDHYRQSWVHTLEAFGEDVQTGPGALMLEAVGRSIRELPTSEPSADQITPEATPETSPITGIRSLDIGRRFLADPDAVGAYLATAERGELARDTTPKPQPVTSATARPQGDPAVLELMRARIDQARVQATAMPTPDIDRTAPQPDAAAPPPEELARLDQALSRAARSYGAAFVTEQAAQDTADLSQDRAPVQLTDRLARLATQRAQLLRTRIEGSPDLSGEPLQTLESRYQTLVTEAELLQAQATAGRPAEATQLSNLRDGLSQDLGDLQQAEDLPADVAGNVAAQLQTAIASVQGLDRTSAPTPEPTLTGDTVRAGRALEQAAQELTAADPNRQVDLNTRIEQEANVGAQQRRLDPVLTQRLWQRSQTGTATLPGFAASRVLATGDAELLPGSTDGDQRLVDAQAGLAASSASLRSANTGLDTETGLGIRLQGQAAARALVPSAGADQLRSSMSQLGRTFSRGMSSLSSVFAAGLRSPRTAPALQPQAAARIAPRLSSAMPTNIFADTSSAQVRDLYLPIVARVAGLSDDPLSEQQETAAPQLSMDLAASPGALFEGLLGEMGAELRDARPKLAREVESRLEEVSRLMPEANVTAHAIADRYTDRLQRMVQGWLDASRIDVSYARAQLSDTLDMPVAERFAPSTLGASPEAIEARLKTERRAIDPSILGRLEQALGKSLADVEAFSGPVAGTMAREMGAQAFTVGRKMFFQEGALDTSSAERAGVLAHELFHAAENNTSVDRREIAREEASAYRIQAAVQNAARFGQSGYSTIPDAIAREMDLPKDIPSEEVAPIAFPKKPKTLAETFEPRATTSGQAPAT